MILEEKDPETILEERRRKRAEIMAKFQAQGRKEKAIDSAVGSPAPDATGGESVTSAGTKTGLNTGSGELRYPHLCSRIKLIVRSDTSLETTRHEVDLVDAIFS